MVYVQKLFIGWYPHGDGWLKLKKLSICINGWFPEGADGFEWLRMIYISKIYRF